MVTGQVERYCVYVADLDPVRGREIAKTQPPRQPEAIGAVVEVTKWLNSSDKRVSKSRRYR